jgi:hypothetical protein
MPHVADCLNTAIAGLPGIGRPLRYLCKAPGLWPLCCDKQIGHSRQAPHWPFGPKLPLLELSVVDFNLQGFHLMASVKG